MKAESSLKFLGYTVDSIEFFLNKEFNQDTVDAAISFSREIKVHEYKSAFVSLRTEIFPEAQKNNFPFNFNITLTGKFDISELEKDDMGVMLENNCLAILFPYLRAIITTYTAMANIDPLILPALNITKMFEDNSSQE